MSGSMHAGAAVAAGTFGDGRGAELGWTAYRVGVASVLLAAASLKAWSVEASGLGLALAEVALAGWLLAGVWPRLCRVIVVLVFSAMAGYALHLARTGQGSCGCFGVVEVPPLVTAIGDAAVVVLGCLTTPVRPAGAHRQRWRAASGGATGVAVAVSLGGAMLVQSPAPGVTVAGRSVALDPAAWTGTALPILADLGTHAAQLGTGEHVLVLSRADCPACSALHRLLPGAGEPPITPVAVDGSGPVALDRAKHWRVATPTALHLIDGQVRAVAQGVDPALALIRQARRSAAAPPRPSADAAPR